jgi:hypothetical protein
VPFYMQGVLELTIKLHAVPADGLRMCSCDVIERLQSFMQHIKKLHCCDCLPFVLHSCFCSKDTKDLNYVFATTTFAHNVLAINAYFYCCSISFLKLCKLLLFVFELFRMDAVAVCLLC